MPFRRTLRPGSRSGTPGPPPAPSPVTTPAATRTAPIPGPSPTRAIFSPSTGSAIEPNRPSAAYLPPNPADHPSSKPGGSAVEETVPTPGDPPSSLPGTAIPSIPTDVVVGSAPTSGAAHTTAVASQVGTVASSSDGLGGINLSGLGGSTLRVPRSTPTINLVKAKGVRDMRPPAVLPAFMVYIVCMLSGIYD